MPRWGLSEQQRLARPWGLDPALLAPGKTTTDPVHGDIYLNRLETAIQDSPVFQRLRRARQLGTTHLVYPGATHSRFAHSLGTLRVTQDLLDAVLDPTADPASHLIAQWRSQSDFERRVGEAVVLARLGGLLHDLCHVPFGHSIEDDLGILTPHDGNVPRFEKLWAALVASLPENVSIPDDLAKALRPIILSKEKLPEGQTPPEPASRYPFVLDLVGNTICADLLDYVARDHYFVGLPFKLGRRFIESFYITRKDDLFYPEHVAVSIRRKGRLRADVVSELFKCLRYRYELSERVLVHHAKLSADAMIGKALEIWYDAIRERSVHAHRGTTEHLDDVEGALQTLDPDLVLTINREASDQIEERLIALSDDAILLELATTADQSRRMGAVRQLARAVIDRQLFKQIAQSDGASRAVAEEIYLRHGGFADRRQLEQDCARFVGLDHRWHVLLWIPAPRMRMKAAEVLVDDGDRVHPLEAYDRAAGQRGVEIYESHKALWAVRIYVHEAVTPLQRQAVGAWLSERLGVRWVESEAVSTPSAIAAVAAGEVARRRGLTRLDERRLAKMDIAASGGDGTLADLIERLDSAVGSLGDSTESKTTRTSATRQRRSENQ